MKKNTKKQILNIIFVIFLVAITLVVLLNSNKELNFKSLSTFFNECNYFYLIAAFGCMIGFVLFEALSIHIILKKLGSKPKVVSSIAYSTSDVYYSAITPSASGGQPASAYYMVRDGVSGGVAGFSLIFNLVGYTLAILIIGAGAFILRGEMFFEFSTFSKVLIVFGVVAQIFLLAFFIGCMMWHEKVLSFSKFIVGFFNKIHIIKNKEKWIARVERAVDKYKGCYEDFKKHKVTLVWVILCNVAQRLSQIMISVLVCKSVINCSVVDVLALQAFVLVGYNSIPLPGGIGAYEYLYLNIYGIMFTDAFIVVSMMVTRTISYYISMILCGGYTITYHLLGKRKAIKSEEEILEQVQESLK